jgi:hypothetical protein
MKSKFCQTILTSLLYLISGIIIGYYIIKPEPEYITITDYKAPEYVHPYDKYNGLCIPVIKDSANTMNLISRFVVNAHKTGEPLIIIIGEIERGKVK